MVTINLTREVIEVLPFIKISKKDDDSGVEIINKDLFWGGTVLENFMHAWGKYNDHIPGSELTEEGRRWDEELENKVWDTYNYMCDNMSDIISIVFYNVKEQLCGKYDPDVAIFNIRPGEYKRKTKTPGIWEYHPLENN